ncbi:hypothetical protein QBC44DRAFT_379679 [Cladorrhinum sp. PSN332]|nr:hypothetical protein QBC44DRAFT_379679 [Cladorrhinum sp. PSN332]
MFLNKKTRKNDTKNLPPTPEPPQAADRAHSPGGVPLSLSGLPSLLRSASLRQYSSETDELQDLRQENARLQRMMQDVRNLHYRSEHQLGVLEAEHKALIASHAKEIENNRDVMEEMRLRESRTATALVEKHNSELLTKEQELKAKSAEMEKVSSHNYHTAQWWLQQSERMKGRIMDLEDQLKDKEEKLKAADELRDNMTTELQASEQKAKDEQEVAEKEFGKQRRELAAQHEREKTILAIQLDETQHKLDELTVAHRAEIERRDQIEGSEIVQLRERMRKLEAELEETNVAHAGERESKRQEYRLSLAAQKQLYESSIKEREARHDGEMAGVQAQLNERVLELEQELMSKPDDFRLGLDGSLKTKYGSLKLIIETITSPWNLGTRAGADKLEKMDQTGFLERAGQDQWHFLLRSMVWARILDGFFSAPYGFGALGSGEDGRSLLGVYKTWKMLLDGNGEGHANGQENFELFYQDKYANAWRSATFQSLLSAIEAAKLRDKTLQDDKDGRKDIATVFADNSSRVREGVVEVISYFCADGISEEIRDQVATAVQQASELSVAFGAHRAKVCFGIPNFGDVIEIGAEFVDCQDGDLKRGKLETVELAVAPALFMIGDGRSDLTSVLFVQHGEIYPVFQNE